MPAPTRTPPRSSAGTRLLVFVAAAATVTALTLAPRGIVGPARGAVMGVVDLFAAPLLSRMSYDEIEGTLNALLFVPLGVALALLLRRWWLLAPLFGFALSFAVETLQARVPGRVPDLHDIVWNTVGTALGSAIAGIVLLVRHRAVPDRAGPVNPVNTMTPGQ